ncbi:MAG TPA: AraC family transcriptional regulator, partial [Streptosporangiaceae bacterium]|nr:AraC family transcriptional regulator [Streptosporangiaceae bacterium]
GQYLVASVSDAHDELLDAIVRLLWLLDRPRDRKVLVPLVKREILWRLPTGDQGEVVRQLGLADSSLSHIRRSRRGPGSPDRSGRRRRARLGFVCRLGPGRAPGWRGGR